MATEMKKHEEAREVWGLKAMEERSPRMNYLRQGVWHKGAYGGQ